MTRMERRFFPALALVGTLLLTACDWESGSQENFNTSGGSANVNVSGVYRGVQGGRVVSNTSNGNITSLTIQQSGNRVDVTDNQGSTYEGTIGAPLVSDDLSDGSVAAGATFASYQISFSGRDGVAARDVNFTGVITLVAVTDTFGDTDTRTNNRSVVTNSVIPPADPSADTGTGTTTDTTTGTTSTTTSTYSITRNNSQLELNGTWVEVGGTASGVSGVGPAAQGNVVVTTTTP